MSSQISIAYALTILIRKSGLTGQPQTKNRTGASKLHCCNHRQNVIKSNS